MKTNGSHPKTKNGALPDFVKRGLRAARRMDKTLRAEHRRWGLPLIVERDGKVVKIPA